MKIRQDIRYLKELRIQNKRRPLLVYDNISYANWWRADPENIWFTRFIKNYWPSLSTQVRFYSVWGKASAVNEKFSGIKVFFSGENLEKRTDYPRLKSDAVAEALWQKRYGQYNGYALDAVDLTMGFGINESEKYIRFPLWILYLFEPEDSYQEIKEKIDAINAIRPTADRHGAVLIASHDHFGTRADILDGLDSVVEVRCAGKWRNNTSELQTKYHDDKLQYLQQFRFNICPENVDAPGYVTEKIFDAYRTGTIPIYHGAGNLPEPDLIRPESAILWNYSADNCDNIALIRKLISDNEYYERFVSRPKLTPYMAEYVYTQMSELRGKLGILFS